MDANSEAKSFPKLGGTTDVIDVAVSEDKLG